MMINTHICRWVAVLAIALVLVLAGAVAHAQGDETAWPVALGERFEVAWAPYGEVSAEQVFADTADLGFQPLALPSQLTRSGNDLWLRMRFEPGDWPEDARVLEFPGHLYNDVTTWLKVEGGLIHFQRTGRQASFSGRPVRHADVAINLPEGLSSQSGMLLVRMWVGVPVPFAAKAWSEPAWQRHAFNQRAWMGVFLGGVLVLLVYNLFFGLVLRDRAYFYYVGYLAALTVSVLSYTSLPEEYLFTGGSRRVFTLPLASVAVFFAVMFVNAFLDIRRRQPLAWQLSTAVAVLLLVFGAALALRLPLIPTALSGNVVHACLLLGGLYFLVASLLSWFQGRREARFLAQSMLVLLVCLAAYLAYTYALLPYHPLLLHAVEIGALAEGMLLSLALADRVRVINQQREAAERAAMDAQRFYARKLLLAQEADRERFSGALHDTIGHGMLVLKQNLEKIAAGLAPGQGGSGPTGLREQIDYCTEILDDVRGMSHDLHPHQLRRLGLATAMRTTMERAFANTDVEWNAEIGPVPEGLSDERQITLYRVTQECVNNVLKHAGASEVILLAESSGDAYNVRIKDDGEGFAPERTGDAGLGLAGMRERIRLFGGRFEIHSAPGEGTEVRFGMPLA